MITINQIATELEEILNGTSANTSGTARPIDGLFAVRTEGYHLDNVHDYETGKNFFPVFIGNFTGEFNPIPELEQVDYEVPVSIYFPVRFKDKMLEMQAFLAKVFVGQAIGFSRTDEGFGQYAVCNISLPELGEITDLDVDQFGNSILKGLNEFISEQYKVPVSSSEPWICLNFTLYMSTMKGALSNETGSTVYGNAYELTLYYYADGLDKDPLSEIITTDNVAFAYGAQTESQQGFTLTTGVSESESSALAVASASSVTFEGVVKRNAFYKAIISDFMNGVLKPNNFELVMKLKDKYSNAANDTDYANYMTVPRKMVLTNLTNNIGINEPLALNFTFTPKAEVGS